MSDTTEIAPLEEVWRPVPDVPGYSVSDRGRVRSEDRMIWTLQGPKRRKGRVLSPVKAGAGYLTVALGTYRRDYVHRLVLEAFLGPCPEGEECRHLDGDPRNNRLDNLAWGTPEENSADKVRHGTHNQGERNPQARLTAAEVRRIRRLRADQGLSLYKLADLFDVSPMTVCRVVNRKTWRHV